MKKTIRVVRFLDSLDPDNIHYYIETIDEEKLISNWIMRHNLWWQWQNSWKAKCYNEGGYQVFEFQTPVEFVYDVKTFTEPDIVDIVRNPENLTTEQRAKYGVGYGKFMTNHTSGGVRKLMSNHSKVSN